MRAVDINSQRVDDMTSGDVVTVRARETIHEALTLMGENCFSALPVVDNQDHCGGILSTSDLVDLTREIDDAISHLDLVAPSSKRCLLDRLTHSLGYESVQSFMSEMFTTVGLETPIGTATCEMLRNRIHHLPVVDESAQLMGTLSPLDILGEVAEAAPDL
ncbi:MAG: CBS domain-containing protein [Planctomycetota bacterium]|nr:CBS domain-containing protein [Planctomycetota bacterium]